MSGNKLLEAARSLLSGFDNEYHLAHDELTITIPQASFLAVCDLLQSSPELQFDLLIDACGVDYLQYGIAEWQVDATSSGFSRAADRITPAKCAHLPHPRFAMVYHLLSTECQHRVRLKVFIDSEQLLLPSLIEYWPAVSWFEREAFDLYGILFDGHPDLRRILTDYGFVGHPFRKDFPVSGYVEVRYDAKKRRVVNEPVEITPRVLVAKTIRPEPQVLDLEEGK